MQVRQYGTHALSIDTRQSSYWKDSKVMRTTSAGVVFDRVNNLLKTLNK